MIAQCSICKKKYNIPDEKVPDNGANIRCKKCHHVIVLKKAKSESSNISAVDSAKNTNSEFNQLDKENNLESTEESIKTNSGHNKKSKFIQIGSNLKKSVNRTMDKIRGNLNDKKFTDREKNKNKSNKSIIGKLEQKILFNYTRVVALAAIVFLFICFTVAIVAYFNVGNKSFVSFRDVDILLHPPNPNSTSSIQDRIPEIRIPSKVSKYLSGIEQKKVFMNWVEHLDQDERKDFINNLNYIINEAEDENPNKVYDYINTYKKVKFAKMQSNQFDKYSQKATKAGIIIIVLFIFGMVGLFSLVLVLLAVERNTRPKLEME